MMVVQIEKPANIPLAAWFTELRSWLDKNNCELLSFFSAGRVIDRIIFNATFADNAQARLFASNFRKYSSSTRRAASSERSGLREIGNLNTLIRRTVT